MALKSGVVGAPLRHSPMIARTNRIDARRRPEKQQATATVDHRDAWHNGFLRLLLIISRHAWNQYQGNAVVYRLRPAPQVRVPTVRTGRIPHAVAGSAGCGYGYIPVWTIGKRRTAEHRQVIYLSIRLRFLKNRADWRHTFPNDNCSSIVVRQLLSQTLEFSADTFFSAAIDT